MHYTLKVGLTRLVEFVFTYYKCYICMFIIHFIMLNIIISYSIYDILFSFVTVLLFIGFKL